MTLKLQTPSETAIVDGVEKIIADTPKGRYCFLPRHIDFVTVVKPGILSYLKNNGEEIFAAVDEGILVKKGPEVTISARDIIIGQGLGSLKKAVITKFESIDDREKKSREILAKLEAEFARLYRELK